MRSQWRGARLIVLGALVALVAVVGTIMAALMAIVGAGGLSCGAYGGTALAAGPAPTRTALREIPKPWLAIYREAGSALDISWPFLASIGYQECGDGTGACDGVNPSGCAGPMEIAYVRGSACSPDPSVPTIWERFKTDGNGDGKTSIFNPADAVFTAAKILREADGAPPAGGSYAEYHEAACNYYGACSDASANYAAEVMARAVGYGFGKAESEDDSGDAGIEPRGGRPEVERDAGRAEEKPGGGKAESVLASDSGPTCEASFVLSWASGNEIVRIALSQLGKAEQPLGSNCQKYGPCEQWCALFVAWVWERAGVPLEGGPPDRAYSGFPAEWVEEHGGHYIPATATPAPGDAVMFGTKGAMEHVGIVERVFPDGEITTIEGNSISNNVARVGPFDPAEAEAIGEPGPIFGYAEPPTTNGQTGGAETHGTKKHRGGVAA
ncbi:MAG TPA: CHAP domain-containing protein [Solirubrobacterales bacterium]|jgi:hypothetical protein